MKKLIFPLLLLLMTNFTFAQTSTPPASGDGTVGNPYQIATLDNLYWLSQTTAEWVADKYFVQTADIDATSTSTWSSGEGFLPVGTFTLPFYGNYDGNSKTISNLHINRPTVDYVGLFGYVGYPTAPNSFVQTVIKNLGITNANVTGKTNIGILVGSNNSGEISNCYTSGTVSSTATTAPQVGGLAGYKKAGKVDFCYSTATVTSLQTRVAGSAAGGLIGYSTNCNVTNCYAQGSVSGVGKNGVGGLIGWLALVPGFTVSKCYSTGAVSGTSTVKGGLIGRFAPSLNATYPFDCYWDTETSVQATSAGGAGVVGKTTAEMQTQSTYTNWDFDHIWGITTGNYPIFSYPAYSGGDGTLGSPYQIATIDDLVTLGTWPSKWAYHFIQTANIDAAGALVSPIGKSLFPFTGSYNGQNFTVDHFTYTTFSDQPIGLFGAVYGAMLSNINLTNLSISEHIATAGGLVGSATNTTVDNCFVSGNVSSVQVSGGMVGYSENSTFNNCGADVAVTGTLIALSSYYENSMNHLGGFVGTVETGSTFANCYARGSVSGYKIGGFVGGLSLATAGASGIGTIPEDMGFTLTNCYAANALTVYTTNTATGTALDPPGEKGGLYGQSIYTGSAITMTNSFWDQELSGTAVGYIGGTGKTTVQMKTQGTYTGWDFSTPLWEIDASKNNGFPYLAWQVFAPTAQPMQLVFTTTDFNQSIALPLYGTVNCTVDWGDGSATEAFTTTGNKEHTFATAGTYTVEIIGSLTHFGDSENVAWPGADFLTDVRDFGDLGLTSLNSAFYGAINLTSVPAILPSTVTDLASCFMRSQSGTLTNLNLWDVSNVTSMNQMFSKNESFNQSLDNWNVSNVTDMTSMFNEASSFNQPLNSWVVSNVTNMRSMFEDAQSFDQALNNWDVSKVEDMTRMFDGASSFNQLLNSWDVSKVTIMRRMFLGAESFDQALNDWVVSSVTDMGNMFDGAFAFNQPLNNWNVSNVTNMRSMFADVTLSSTNYDAILIAWAAQTVQPYVIFDGGNSQYSAGAAATARGVLTGGTNLWEIFDGGEIVSTTTDITSSTSASLQPLTPSSDITITATGSLVIDQTTAVNSITVTVGGKLTVNSGSTLTAAVTLESSALGTGTLVDSYTTPTLTATVQQYLPQGRNWYLSVPTSSGNTSSFIGAGLATSVSYYNEAAGAWVDDYTGTMTPGRGYVAVSAAGAGNATNNTSFSGTLNSGDVPVTLTRTGSGSFAGYNLIANPYPSYVNPMAALNALNVEKTIWYRTKGATYKFETVNIASGVGTNAAGTGQVTGYIPPFQAFWVRTNVTGQELTFTNGMRDHANPSGVTTTALKARNQALQPITRIKINGNAGSDETVLYFNTAASNSFDNYDSRKMFETEDIAIPEIYTQLGNEKLVINGLNTVQYETEIPLGFVSKQAGDFSISANEFSNFEAGTSLILKDKLYPNQDTELSTETVYNFNVSTATESSNRFSLIFRAKGVATNIGALEKLNAQVYVNAENKITIIAPEKSIYSIYNTVGQMLENGKITAKLQTVNSKLQTGIYVIRVSENGKELTTRVIIK